MSIALLQTLIAVSDHGRFSAAAEASNLTQAAVGQPMKRLEQSLRVTVLDRSRKSPQLDPVAKSRSGLLADKWLSQHGVTVSAFMEMESLELLTSMVSHNLVVSIVPDVCVFELNIVLVQTD